MKKLLCLAFALILTLSFTAFASEFICVKTSVDGASVIWAKEKSISIEFSQEVNNVVVNVTENGEIFNDFNATRNLENTKVVDVVFDNDLEYGATYVIDFSGCVATGDIPLTGSKTFHTFTVEAAPVVEVTSASILNGIGTGTITTADELSANDTVQGFVVNLKNNDYTEAKSVAVFGAIYDSNGTLIKVVTSEKTIAADTEDTVGLGTVIPSVDVKSADPYVSVAVAGGKAKLFIWNSVVDKSPYVGSITFDIQ